MALSTKPPAGMRDFLPSELAKRRFVINAIQTVYEKYGFLPLETPAVENLSALLGKYGDEGDKLLFKIMHRRDKLSRALSAISENKSIEEKDLGDIGLRYDLTVPLARVVADNGNLPAFFKRYQIQPVWRADRPGKGRFREFLQCDIDITGTKSLIAEAEVCSAVSEVLLKLGFDNFFIHINHRQLLKCLIEASGIAENLEESVLTAVDKLDKIGLEGVEKELAERGVSDIQAQSLINLIKRDEGANDKELDRLKAALNGSEAALTAIDELERLVSLLNSSKAAKHYKLDASLARGLGYYTGAIFEIRSSDFVGSLGGGGRYDNLIGMFKGSSIPAVGFSIGFERLMLVLEEKGLFKAINCAPDVLVCHFADASNSAVISAAAAMRDKGVKVEIYPETPKIKKQISYANSIGAAFIAIIGAEESEKQLVALKNLKTGEQKTLNYSDAAEAVKNTAAS